MLNSANTQRRQELLAKSPSISATHKAEIISAVEHGFDNTMDSYYLAANPHLTDDDFVGFLEASTKMKSTKYMDLMWILLREHVSFPPKTRRRMIELSNRLQYFPQILHRVNWDLIPEEVDALAYAFNLRPDVIAEEDLRIVSERLPEGYSAPQLAMLCLFSKKTGNTLALVKNSSFMPNATIVRSEAQLEAALPAHPEGVTLQLPLRTLLELTVGEHPHYYRYCRSWDLGELFRPRNEALKLRDALIARTGADFFNMFAWTWEGTAEEFIDSMELMNS